MPLAPFGIPDLLELTVVDWILTFLGWAGAIGFLWVGAMFCYAYMFDDDGPEGAIRSLITVAVGCILVSASGFLAEFFLLSPDECFGAC